MIGSSFSLVSRVRLRALPVRRTTGHGIDNGTKSTSLLPRLFSRGLCRRRHIDGTTWSHVQVAGPPPRLGAGAAYDSKRGLVLIFGGSNHGGVFNDLWSWDGTEWKKLAEGGPEPRVMGYIAYDKARDRVVLFGGRRGTPDNTDLGDTWEWDGATWRRIIQ